MQRIITRTEILDENWQKIPDSTPSSEFQGKPFVAHTFQYNEVFLVKSKPTTKAYKLFKDGREVSLPVSLLKQIRKDYPELKVGQVFDKLAAAQPDKQKIKIKEPLSYYIRLTAGILAVVGLVAIPLGYGLLISERNFGAMRSVSDVNDLKVGEYVEAPMYIVDAFEVTNVTTRKLYGVIETSKSETRGNVYLLAVADPNTRATYIYRYDPDHDKSKELDNWYKTTEDIYFGKIQGEVKPLKEIEHMTQSGQVTEFFQEAIDNYQAKNIDFKAPAYLIDGRVTQADIKVVYIAMAVIITLTLASWIMLAASYRIYAKAIQRMSLSLTKNVA